MASIFCFTLFSTDSFGMVMPGRSNADTLYRYAYNGMEKDDAVKGAGNSYTTEFRQYDPRLGRWLSLDPVAYAFPSMSPYVAFDDNPVLFVDPSGLFSKHRAKRIVKKINKDKDLKKAGFSAKVVYGEENGYGVMITEDHGSAGSVSHIRWNNSKDGGGGVFGIKGGEVLHLEYSKAGHNSSIGPTPVGGDEVTKDGFPTGAYVIRENHYVHWQFDHNYVYAVGTPGYVGNSGGLEWIGGPATGGARVIKGSKYLRNSKRLSKTIRNYAGKTFTISKNQVKLTKGGVKHILQRHHKKYWNGTVKAHQTFLPRKWGINDIEKGIEVVMTQNRELLAKKGSKLGTTTFQIEGTFEGHKVVVGFKNGKVGQFYTKQ